MNTKKAIVIALGLLLVLVGARVWSTQVGACEVEKDAKGQIPAYSIKLGKTLIRADGKQLTVNGKKADEGKIVVGNTRITLNGKRVLCVDDGRDRLLIWATNKPLPKQDKKVQIKIGNKVAYAGRWLEGTKGKVRKVAYLAKYGFWAIQISQMQDKASAKNDKTPPELFKQAVLSFQVEVRK